MIARRIRSILLAALVVGVSLSATSAVRFVDVTKEAGIDFTHVDGRSGRKYLLETLGSGAAFFDYDNDGYLDLYVVNGADLPGHLSDRPPTNRLYRNRGDGTFADVTAIAGVGDPGYGFGCAVADIDNDGDLDLYVTNNGPNRLYLNNGDGTFTEIAQRAGVDNPRWSTSSAFLDYDRDGYVDLYVVNYMKFSVEENRPWEVNGILTYRSPVDRIAGSVFVAEPDALYHNNGDTTFTDVTREAGISFRALGLAVAVGDYDDDGDPDIAVANDMEEDALLRNEGDGTFTDVALFAGTAYDENGMPGSGMGASFGDVDNDGDLDLTVSNASSMPVMLYRNEGNGLFSDVSYVSGIGRATLTHFKWAVEFFDYDNDGYLDLFVANGHLQENIGLFSDATYAQPDQLLRNTRAGAFEDVSDETGIAALPWKVSRGAAFGDIDNDGDLDVFLNNSNQPATLLRNDGGNGGQFLMLRTIGTRSNRDGIGARIRLTAGDLVQTREVRSGSSYLSQNDLRVHFGLGNRSRVERIEVRWPSGLLETYRDVPAGQQVTLIEGRGMKSR